MPVSIDDAAAAWDNAPLTEVLDNINALLAFGFLERSGEGSERRIRISDLGRRLLEDRDQAPHLMAEAAMKPKLIADHIERWGRTRPTNDVCIPELTAAHGFSDQEAKLFLRVYDGTYLFACKAEAFDVPAPSPQFAGPRGRQKPPENILTKWLPELEQFCNEMAD
jgi:hypothetical protein